MNQKVSYNRETLLELFRNGEVQMKFRKVDGGIRLLRGTLRGDMIPEQNETKSKRATRSAHANPALITVWDLDAEGWRSFYADCVTEIL